MEAFIDFIPGITIVIIFYSILIIPQQRKRKRHAKFISELKIGDNVITDSGIKGRVSAIKDDTIALVLIKGELELNKINVSRRL